MIIRTIKLTTLALLIVGVSLCGLFFLGSDGTYTEQDKLKYHFTTPYIIANAPRVTNHYDFSYIPDDNYGFERNSITFYEIVNFKKAEEILSQYAEKQSSRLNVNEELVINTYNGNQKSLTVTLITYTRR